MDDKRPLYWMVLFGVVRSALAWLGGWLSGRGFIDDGTMSRFLSSDTAVNVTAFIVSMLPVIWTVAQKLQVFSWLQTKVLKREGAELASAAPPSAQSIITASPGPNMPI